MRKLKHSEIAEWREETAKKQGGKCPITGWYLTDKVAADHDHKGGMMRAVLPIWVNSVLGRLEGWSGRVGAGVNGPDFLRKCADYIEFHNNNPSFLFHPLHKTPEEKKLAAKVKAAARRKTLKAAK